MVGGEPVPATPRLLRAINDRAALELLLEHGSLTRAQLCAMTGLSKPTAGQLLARLTAAGLVRAVGTSGGRPGPAARLFEVDPGAGYAAGVDVRPQRVAAAVCDLHGTRIAEIDAPVPRRGSAPDGVATVVTALDAACTAAGVERRRLAAVTVGSPGALDPRTGRLRYAKHLAGWHDPALLRRLRDEIGARVGLENDVNLVALAERGGGAGRDVEDFLLLWNDDGFGAALVLGGRLHRGSTGGAGELGYVPVPGAPLVRHVNRGNTGGYVQIAGAPAILELAARHGVRGRRAPDVVAKAAAHEVDSNAFLDELAERVATGLASAIAVVDPAAVLLSGAVLLAGGEPLRARIEDALGELAMTVPLVRLGEVTGNPILAGALQAALDSARDAVFATP